MSLYVDYEDLEIKHGQQMADVLFEEFKETPPIEPVSRDFADYIINQLPKGFATYVKSQWGLENEDSDCYLQWCEQHTLHIPSINAEVFIEVGDYHYYVNVERFCHDDGWWDNLTCKHQQDVIDYILETVETISINDENMYKSGN